MKVLSLFSGIGGFDIACEWANMEVVGQVEIDPFCLQVLEKHWPDVKRMGDIKNVKGDEFGTVDIITGGVPCQPASIAGQRRGSEDDRWLWPETLRIVKAVKPKWCVFENPTGILSLQGGVPFDNILSEMEGENYEVGAYIIPASAVGAPHRRERVFIVAYSRCELPQGAEFGGKDEVEVGGKLADQHKRPSEAREDVVANPGATRLQGAELNGNYEEKTIRGQEGATGATSQCNSNAGAEGSAQPRVGGVSDGISAGMDGTWPAGTWPTPNASDGTAGSILSDGTEFVKKGNTIRKLSKSGHNFCISLGRLVQLWPSSPGDQHEWEPPRVAKGVKDRVPRLKALGNALVPQQCYPILKAIAEMEEIL